MFSPLRFVKFRDPSSYQGPVRRRLERDTFSHNLFSLSFGKHVAAYKSYVEAQDYLSKKSQDAKILLRALRHLPRLKDVTVVFRNEIIGAREIMSTFGLLNGSEITLDSEYTLPLLMEALSEAGRKLDIFKLVSDEGTPWKLFCDSRTTFNESHEPRFRYVSSSPTNVTATALLKAFLSENWTIREKMVILISSLRVFNMSGLTMDSNHFIEWSDALAPIVAHASSLEGLSIMPNATRNPEANGQRLHLSSILHESTHLRRLQYLTLKNVNSPDSLLVELFTRSSASLVDVTLLYVQITGSKSWSGVFRKLRNVEFKVLKSFVLLDCGEAQGVMFDTVRAENYLRRITDKCPIAEYSGN